MNELEQREAIRRRQAEKRADRLEDLALMEQGVPPEEIQRKNSILSEGQIRRVRNARIRNLEKIVGI